MLSYEIFQQGFVEHCNNLKNKINLKIVSRKDHKRVCLSVATQINDSFHVEILDNHKRENSLRFSFANKICV
jgi:hypothetical protein